MLRVARRKPARVRWVRQDIERLRLDVRADVVTCHFDALNHVLEAEGLQRVLVNVARTLRPGGLFQFDLNTRFMLQWLSTSEKLFRLGPHAFTAYNEFDAASGIAIFHQLWFVKQGRLFRKVEVSVRERAFDDAEVRRMLRDAGLRLERVTVQRRLKGRPIRKVYLAVRPAGDRAQDDLMHLEGAAAFRREPDSQRRPHSRNAEIACVKRVGAVRHLEAHGWVQWGGLAMRYSAAVLLAACLVAAPAFGQLLSRGLRSRSSRYRKPSTGAPGRSRSTARS